MLQELHGITYIGQSDNGDIELILSGLVAAAMLSDSIGLHLVQVYKERGHKSAAAVAQIIIKGTVSDPIIEHVMTDPIVAPLGPIPHPYVVNMEPVGEASPAILLHIRAWMIANQ